MFFGRGLNKVQNVYNTTDMYSDYVDWVEKKEAYTLRRADFVTIIDEFNKGVVKALFEGKEFHMPAGFGKFRIIKKIVNIPITKVSHIDWKTTNEIGKVVHHRNQHSDGHHYKLLWDKLDNGVRNGHKYYFYPCRAFKRTLAKIIKAKENDYFQVN